MNDKRALLSKLQMCDFAINEAVLFLDTHPTDQQALAYCKKYQLLRDKIVEEYASKYGPISVGDASDAQSWEWVANPWPWEMEA